MNKTIMTARRCLGAGWIAFAYVALATAPLAGQSAVQREFALRLGATSYDLAGVGTAVLVGAALPIHMTGTVTVEPALSVLRYAVQGGPDHAIVFLPELTILARVTLSAARIYMGAGGGFSAAIGSSGGLDGTGHLTAGVDFEVGPEWRLGPEARVRSIDPFRGSTADLTVRFTRRL